MDKSGFAILFETAVRRAFQQAGLVALKSELLVEFHGKPYPVDPITMEQTQELLWLSPDQFFRFVDVAVIIDAEGSPLFLFVRPSGHEPGPFSYTWNPNDLGPFRSIGPMTRGKRA